MAGWGEDPVLEELRTLIVGGWQVVSIDDEYDTPDGPADKVVVTDGEQQREFISDHLAFHRYVAGLQGETY